MSLDRKNVAIYLRKSADREGRALGIARQEEDCRAEVARHPDWKIVMVAADNDISASSRSRKPRPEYERMLAAVDDGRVDLVVAYSTSRLTRRPMEFEELIRRAESGLTIVTTRTGDLDLNTARGRRRARDDAARDAEYAEELSELALRERQQRREQGRWHGGMRPFGWEADGMTPRPVEQELIRSGCHALLAGRSVAAIARDWTAQLGGSAHGRPAMRPTTTRDILANPRIAGLMPDGRTRARWPAVVDEDTWRGVVAVLADPGRRRHRGPTRLLTAIGLCGICHDGSTVHGGQARTGAATYRCASRRHLDRLAGPVDDWVTRVLITYLRRERVAPASRANDAGGVARLAAEAAGLRARSREALVMWQAGEISRDELRDLRAQLGRELDAVEARLAKASRSSALADIGDGDPAQVWQAADIDRRRAILRSVGMTVTLMPPGRGIRRVDDDFLEATVLVRWPEDSPAPADVLPR